MGPVLACDIGGTRFRLALIGRHGERLADWACDSPPVTGTGGIAEIEPEGWWQRFLEGAEALRRQAAPEFARIAAITICGATRTQILVDREGHALRPAIGWGDTRAVDIARAIRAECRDTTGEAAALNAFHPLARLGWLARFEPETLARAAHVLEPKDFLALCLCGQAASDTVSMARLSASKEDGLLPAAAVSEGLIPPIFEPWQRVGSVRAGHSGALGILGGVPVIAGANDTFAAVLGLGAMQDGLAYNISGTTEVFGVISARRLEAEGLLSVDWRGLHQLGGPSQTGADAARWLSDLLGSGNPAALLGRIAGTWRHSQPLLFLPYLAGERVPYWDPDLRGAFVGLNRQHGETDLAFAVLEGVAFLNRTVLARAEAALGNPVRAIRLGGGAAASPLWARIKADITGRPVILADQAEPGLTGAAILGFLGIGVHASLTQAQGAMVRISTEIQPDPARRAAYDQLFALFQAAEIALGPVSRMISGLDGGLPALLDRARN